MENDKIAKENHAFFFVAVGMALCDPSADAAVVHSFYQNGKSQYEIENDAYPGCMRINSVDVMDMHLHECLAEKVHKGILSEVALKIPFVDIGGKLNDELEIIHDKYRFNFRITTYEPNRDHEFELINNHIDLSDNDQIGRVVEMIISPL